MILELLLRGAPLRSCEKGGVTGVMEMIGETPVQLQVAAEPGRWQVRGRVGGCGTMGCQRYFEC